MSRCCSGPCGVNTSRGSSTDFCCPGKSRCSSGPCDLDTSRSNSGFFVHTVQSFQQISIIFLTPRGNLGMTIKYIYANIRNSEIFHGQNAKEIRKISRNSLYCTTKFRIQPEVKKPLLWTPFAHIFFSIWVATQEVCQSFWTMNKNPK